MIWSAEDYKDMWGAIKFMGFWLFVCFVACTVAGYHKKLTKLEKDITILRTVLFMKGIIPEDMLDEDLRPWHKFLQERK